MIPSNGTTERVSVASDGAQGDEKSYDSTISADGRFVAFLSWSSNLVPGDDNGQFDLFVYDRQIHQTERVSIATNGDQANGSSWDPDISADGRFVVFVSEANNLDEGDINGDWVTDVYLHDRQTHQTELISVSEDGIHSGNGYSELPAVSDDGRFIAFSSSGDDLVNGDSNGEHDIFVHDRRTGLTERVSVAPDGTQGNESSASPSISADGRFVAFSSEASNLVSGDVNSRKDIFVYNRDTGQAELVSLDSDGTQANQNSYEPSISSDGRYVAFHSFADNLVNGDTNGNEDIYVYDRQTNHIECVSIASDGTQGNGNSGSPSISSDGRFVTFWSDADNLVSGDANGKGDIFVHDQQLHQTVIVSLASDGAQGENTSTVPSISANGQFVAFQSEASNLVDGDTNGHLDVFIRNGE